MRTFLILFRKELKSFFFSPFGWVVMAFVVLMNGISLSMAMKGFRDSAAQDSLVYVAFHTPVFWFFFLFIFPLITMRSFAGEERSGTLETLLTAPVHTWQVVISKFSASYVFYALLWVPTLLQLKLFDLTTQLPPAYNGGAVLGTYSIILLMGGFFVAIGCLASSLTSSQIIAGILTIFLLILQNFLGYVTVIWGENFSGAGAFHYISNQQHLHSFAKGVLDSRPVVYYLSMAAFTLFLTYQVVDFRRWRK